MKIKLIKNIKSLNKFWSKKLLSALAVSFRTKKRLINSRIDDAFEIEKRSGKDVSLLALFHNIQMTRKVCNEAYLYFFTKQIVVGRVNASTSLCCYCLRVVV